MFPEYNYQVPQNVTVGIKFFCINYTNYTSCKLLPLQVSELLASLPISHSFDHLNYLDYSLARLLYKTIAGCLIISIVLTFCYWCILAFILSNLQIPHRQVWVGRQNLFLVILYIAYAAMFCIVCAFPYFILHSIHSNAYLLGSDIRMEIGCTAQFCLGVLCSAFCIVVFASLTLLLNQR